MLAEAGVLTDSFHITGLAGIELETRLDGSLPQRKARPMDEKVCFWGKLSTRRSRGEGSGTYQI